MEIGRKIKKARIIGRQREEVELDVKLPKRKTSWYTLVENFYKPLSFDIL